MDNTKTLGGSSLEEPSPTFWRPVPTDAFTLVISSTHASASNVFAETLDEGARIEQGFTVRPDSGSFVTKFFIYTVPGKGWPNTPLRFGSRRPSYATTFFVPRLTCYSSITTYFL